MAIGCDDPTAALQITDARAARDAQSHTIVDIDVVGHEALGKNVGGYCAKVTFVGQTDPSVVCNTDLRDGDRRTVRVLSQSNPDPGSAIGVSVELGAVAATWGGLVAPPR
jgi:hypothetical protein